jgi:hypothetical protein
MRCFFVAKVGFQKKLKMKKVKKIILELGLENLKSFSLTKFSNSRVISSALKFKLKDV